tara:strand:- start:1042 stop:2679 length:1638 start_codon:yes stop_codon:yes gene_type:complete
MGLFSSIDFGAFAAGAADQYVENVEKKNDYYRDLMTKQEDYMMRYGRKIVNDRTSMANSAVEMLDALEAGGLDPKSAEELVSNYGYQGVSALKKLQEQFQNQYDGATLDLNAVFKGSEDYVKQEGYDIDQALKDQFLVEVAKADTGAGDVASDAEDRGFLASLGDMFVDGGGAKARYEASRTAPSVAGYNYDQVLQMEGMGMPASRGLPTFDRSALADPDAGKLGITEQRAYKSMYETKIVSAIGSQYFLEGMGNIAYDTANESDKVAYAMSKNPEKVAEVMQGLYGQYGIEGNNLLLSTLQGIDITPETEEEKTIRLVEQGAGYGLSPDDIGKLEVLNGPDNKAAAREWFAANPDAEYLIYNGNVVPYEMPSDVIPPELDLNPVELGDADDGTADAAAPPEGMPDIRLARDPELYPSTPEGDAAYKQFVIDSYEEIKVSEPVIEKSITDLTANEVGLTVANSLAEAWYSAEPTVVSLDNWFKSYIFSGAANTTAFIQGLFGVSAEQSNGNAAWLEELSIKEKEIALAKMAAAMASIQERREANE